MPHKDFHGKTGVVYNVTKSAVGIILYSNASRPCPAMPAPSMPPRIPPRAFNLFLTRQRFRWSVCGGKELLGMAVFCKWTQ